MRASGIRLGSGRAQAGSQVSRAAAQTPPGRLPREPAEPEIAAEDAQEDDHADHPARPRLPDGLSPGGLVADLPDPRDIIPPGNPRIGPAGGRPRGRPSARTTNSGYQFGSGGFGWRMTGGGRSSTISSGSQAGSGGTGGRASRGTPSGFRTPDPEPRSSSSRTPPVGGAQLDEGIIRAAAIRSSVPDADPECVLDLVAGASSDEF